MMRFLFLFIKRKQRNFLVCFFIEVKCYRFLYTIPEVDLRFPSECSLDLCSIDRIALVVSWTISDEFDKRLAFSHLGYEYFRDLEIRVFIVSSDIIDTATLSTGKYFPHGFAVIDDVEPVADVRAISIEGNGLIVFQEVDEMWDQFLMILMWSIVIRATRDRVIDTERPPIGTREHIACGFRSRVW